MFRNTPKKKVQLKTITYKYKKSKFYKVDISLGLILVVVAVFSFWYTRSYLETGALLALALLGVIPAANYVCFDYKNPAQILKNAKAKNPKVVIDQRLEKRVAQMK